MVRAGLYTARAGNAGRLTADDADLLGRLLLVVRERPGVLLQARYGRGDLAAAATTSKRLHVYSMRRITAFMFNFGRAQLTELTH